MSFLSFFCNVFFCCDSNFDVVFFDNEEQDPLGWNKWYGKVLGTEEEIKAALRQMKNEPKDAMELQQTISAIRREQMKELVDSFY